MDVIAYLIGYTITLDDYKQEVQTETRSMVYGKKESISRAEFYSAGQSGLQPAFRLTVASIDYHGETELEVDSARYGIYRTYDVNADYIELYCEKKGGLQP